ncbi:MAG: family 16 glycosylhydrolase [Paludibacter sp.]|nr:family 16 glycosylhydrolase [Paludibacter sp.]MDD4427730.1 family 16 glycosylhydrolase [Paludibacter sp.]
MRKIHVLVFSSMLLLSKTIYAEKVDFFSADPNPPREIPGMTLVWSDEFNVDGKPDPKNWKYEKGFVRNEELQWYQSDNVNCKDGLLVIEGKQEQVLNPNYLENSTDWKKNRQYADYTSSSIISQGLQQFQYGRFEIRARIDTTTGSWPAIWTKGISGKWPFCGEIDIMEFYRDKVSGVRTTPILLANVAWGHATNSWGAWNTQKVRLKYFTNQDPDWCEKFHVWRMEWTEDFIDLYLDDELLNTTLVSNTQNPDGYSPSEPHRQKHFLLLNLAIGANGGNPVPSDYPVKYEVDYVRVYQTSPNAVHSDIEKTTRIFPNPVSDFLVVESEEEIQNISIYNVTGQLLFQQNILPEKKINLSELESGFYFIRLKFYDGSELVRQIIKKM